MTATILLIRHAAHSQLDHVLSGRTPGISLSGEGRSQAGSLSRRLAQIPLAAVQASPVQRAQETARAIAAGRLGIGVETVAALDELDFGEWSGRAFAELAEDPRWTAWNDRRAIGVAPDGESMAEAQARAWDHIQRTAAGCEDSVVAMVTHCDIIRAVVALVMGLSLDHLHRFEVAPASVSRVVVGSWGAKVLSLNETCP